MRDITVNLTFRVQKMITTQLLAIKYEIIFLIVFLIVTLQLKTSNIIYYINIMLQ